MLATACATSSSVPDEVATFASVTIRHHQKFVSFNSPSSDSGERKAGAPSDDARNPWFLPHCCKTQRMTLSHMGRERIKLADQGKCPSGTEGRRHYGHLPPLAESPNR